MQNNRLQREKGRFGQLCRYDLKRPAIFLFILGLGFILLPFDTRASELDDRFLEMRNQEMVMKQKKMRTRKKWIDKKYTCIFSFAYVNLLRIQYLIHIDTYYILFFYSLFFFCNDITGNNIIDENVKDKITSR